MGLNDLFRVARPSRIAAAVSTADHCQIGVAISSRPRKDLEKVYARRKRVNSLSYRADA
jgi:hypothetical protein